MWNSRHISILLLVGSCAHGYDEGYEYTYQETGIQTTGTMDHAPTASGISWMSTVRIQYRGNKAYVELSELKYSQYVGDYPTDHSIWKNNNFVDQNIGKIQYVINYDNDGKINSVSLPRSASVQMRNQLKAQAAMLQWETKQDNLYLERREKLLHGDCNVHYTINDAVTMRSVNHFMDCKDRPFRRIDDWRGWRCDAQYFDEAHEWGGKWTPGRQDPDPYSSKSDAYYVFAERDGRRYVQSMGVEAGVGTRFFGKEGDSKFIYTRRNMVATDVKSSSGNINPTDTETYSDLTYEMVNHYAWNKDRNLKDSEEILDTGSMFLGDKSVYVQAVMSALDEIVKNFDLHDSSEETVNKLHKYGTESAMYYMIALDYDSLKSVYNGLEGDSSETGVAKMKLFLEFLSSTGTTASAMFVMDCVRQGKCFEDSQSSGRALLGIPYHIRRPNVQLVNEMKRLTSLSNQEEAVTMALPLAIAHLARRTCELADKSVADPGFTACVDSLLNPMSDEYFAKLMSASSDDEKMEYLAVLQNIRWGKISDLLEDYLKSSTDSDAVKADAVTAAVYSTYIKRNTASYFLPIIINPLQGTETRANALLCFIHGEFDITQLSTVVTTLYEEKNFEFKNYAYSLFEAFSDTLNPCFQKKKDLISYYYRYMKQVRSHDINYGFGISKFYVQEFESTRYENTGSNFINIIGSTKSQLPLKLGVWVSSSNYGSYSGSVLGIELRFEGLSRTVLKKIQNINGKDWKLSNLKQLMDGMNIILKQEEPVRVGITVTLKGSIIMRRSYFSQADEADKKITELLNDLRGRGGKNTYSINHQRALTYGMEIYEQPTDVGTPMFYVNSMTTVVSLQAEVNKGLSKGVLFRELKNDIHMVTNAKDIMSFMHGYNKFHLYQSRAYSLHVPQELVVGINIVKQELKIEFKRAEQSKPLFLILHARTQAGVRELAGGSTKLKTYCATCEDEHVLANGDSTSKAIAEDDNSEFGYRLWGEYFDCESDLSDANIGGNAVYAFHPQNKNPQTFMTSFLMGLRQSRAWVLNYPRAEKCGAYMQWSQSTVNPVQEVHFSAQLNFDTVANKYYYRGTKVLVKSLMEVQTPNGRRKHKLNLKYETSPGGINNKLMAQYTRDASAEMPEYAVCFSFENEYPDLPDAFMNGNLDAQKSYNAALKVRYGETKSCSEATGKISTRIAHETTPEATQELKTKDYYKTCMNEKKSSTWSSRTSLPITNSCWLANYDATNARKYHWDIKFEGVSPEVRAYFEKGETVLKTAVLPYWDLDPKALQRTLDEEPELKLDILFKNKDKLVDIKLETDKGVSDFKDMPVKVPVYGGPLSNLEVDTFGLFLARNNLIDWCFITNSGMRMLDNITIPFAMEPSCWTLVSADCGPEPKYAVFVKPAGPAPLQVKVFLGGHEVEMTPASSSKVSVKVNGGSFDVANEETQEYKSGSSEIFKLSNWGGTMLLMSPDVVSVHFDGTFVQVVPNPITKGEHCGACGNYDGNKFNNILDMQGQTVPVQWLPERWCNYNL